MAKRHQNKNLQMGHFTEGALDPDGVLMAVQIEDARARRAFGGFNSDHELYAVLKEELDEFWDSVKTNDPDPSELIQIAAVALRGAQQLCQRGVREVEARSPAESTQPEKGRKA